MHYQRVLLFDFYWRQTLLPFSIPVCICVKSLLFQSRNLLRHVAVVTGLPKNHGKTKGPGCLEFLRGVLSLKQGLFWDSGDRAPRHPSPAVQETAARNTDNADRGWPAPATIKVVKHRSNKLCPRSNGSGYVPHLVGVGIHPRYVVLGYSPF